MLPRFLIERNTPGRGDVTPEQLADVSHKMTRVYLAPNAGRVRTHTRRGRIRRRSRG